METKDDQKPLRHFVFRCEGNAFHGQSFSENSFKKNFLFVHYRTSLKKQRKIQILPFGVV